MDPTHNRTRKRPASESVDVMRQHATRRPAKRACRTKPAVLRDPLTSLPQELLTDILLRVAPNPVDNVRLQQVDRAFCRTLRDNNLWSDVSPDRLWLLGRPPEAAAIYQHDVMPFDDAGRPERQTLYWAFQSRTARGPQGYDRVAQRMLVTMWQKKPFAAADLATLRGRYDLARAAVWSDLSAFFYVPFGDDTNMMRALAHRGPPQLNMLSRRLREDASFMTAAVDANPKNYEYAIWSPSLRRNDAFNLSLLRKIPSLLGRMPTVVRGNKDAVLESLHKRGLSRRMLHPRATPYGAVSEQLRQDPEIVYACARLCVRTFGMAIDLAPRRRWDEDRILVGLILSPVLYRTVPRWPTTTEVFARVHQRLRDDEAIALQAITLDADNYGLVSARLRLDPLWCARAARANEHVIGVLNAAVLANHNFVNTLSYITQLRCLPLLKATVGSSKTMLLAMLQDPEVHQLGYWPVDRQTQHSRGLRIAAPLREDADVRQALLHFDAREFRYFPSPWRDDVHVRAQAVEALLAQLRAQEAITPLNHLPAFSVPYHRQRKCDHGPLGVFGADADFAKRFLQTWPQLWHLFASSVRDRLDITKQARLGALLQEEGDLTRYPKGSARSLAGLLASSLRRAPNDFALNLALGANYMLRQDARLAKPKLLMAMSIAPGQTTRHEGQLCRWLLTEIIEKGCPAPGQPAYKAVLALVRKSYQRLVTPTEPCEQAQAHDPA